MHVIKPANHVQSIRIAVKVVWITKFYFKTYVLINALSIILKIIHLVYKVNIYNKKKFVQLLII